MMAAKNKDTEVKALRENVAQYRQLVEISPDWVWRIDLEGCHTYTNPSVYQLLGYNVNEIVGTNAFPLIHPDDGQPVRDMLKQCIEQKVGWHNVAIRWLHKDGSVRSFESTSSPMLNADGQVTGFSGIDRDITKRKVAEEELLKKNEELKASYEQIAAAEEELHANLNELTRQELELRESEERYRTVFENTGTAMVVLEANGIISLANNGFVQLSGFSKEDIEGKKIWTGFVHKEDLERMLAQNRLRQQDEGKALTHYEFRFVTRSGDLRAIHLSVGVIPGTKKSIASLLDVTERKRVDEELHRVSNLLNRILARITDSVISLDTEWRYTYCNDTALKLIRGTRDEIIGRSIWDVFPDIVGTIFWDKYHEAMREQVPVVFDNYYTPYEVWTAVRVFPSREGLTIVVTDITEHRRGEERLKESEQKYRDIFENSVVGLFKTAPDGRMTSANNALALMYGYAGSAEILKAGVNVRQLYANPEDRQEVLHILAEKGRVENYEAPHIKQCGTRFWVSITARTIRDTEGAVLFYEGTTIDISERMRSQKALDQAKKKLNLLNYVTFNDIQNMIFTLSGYQQLAKEKITESPVKSIIGKQDEILQKISHSLKFAQSYQDLGLKPPQWQDVNHVFLLAISHLDFLKINHTVLLDGLEIYADPLLEQVFQILADNILIHGKTATQVTLTYTSGPESITLFFEDNGVGILKDTKTKMFSPDFQKEKGVGLFLSREILDITGITITETGEPGKGARFEMTVPKGMWRIERKIT
ncbi:MAG: PAS domain S-box protein [Methanomicrobiales archaeon]